MGRRKPRNRWLDLGVYLAVRLVVTVAQCLSIEQSYALADGLAWLAYRVDRRHRRVAIENLRAAFGDRYDDEELDRLVRSVYGHFCRMVLEMMHIPRKLTAKSWRRRISLRGHADLVERLVDGGPLIILTGHFGNWEMAGYVFGVFGFRPYSVARPLDNPYLDAYLRRFRERTGQRLIAKKGGSELMVDVLEEGGVIALLADRDAGQKGMFVDFFGRPASTHKAIALLAAQYRAPIAVGFARRVGSDFHYEVGCERIIDTVDFEGSPGSLKAITQSYTTALETLIRRDPDQYLWLHRRWKHQPQPKRRKDAATDANETAS